MTRVEPVRESARERLLDTAERLFYAEGVHTVGIDRVLAESGVAKATLYKNFGNKDGLVTAYLDRRHERQVARITAALDAVAEGSPRERILAVFDSQRILFARPDYRGCAFAAATAEGPHGGPYEESSRTYRNYVRTVFAEILAEAGVAEAERVASQLHLIYDGAQMAARMDSDPTNPELAANTRMLAESVLSAAGL
ncbi:MAG: TetR/AcrR family transcriptional regulator [Nocardioides sp.]